MQVTLSAEEAELLDDILSNYLSDLRMEISNTDNYDFRQSLQKREAMVKSLIGRVERSAGA